MDKILFLYDMELYDKISKIEIKYDIYKKRKFRKINEVYSCLPTEFRNSLGYDSHSISSHKNQIFAVSEIRDFSLNVLSKIINIYTNNYNQATTDRLFYATKLHETSRTITTLLLSNPDSHRLDQNIMENIDEYVKLLYYLKSNYNLKLTDTVKDDIDRLVSEINYYSTQNTNLDRI